MGADFSRVRFDPLNDFAGVDMQQGRVLLDGDFNELVDIIDRRFRAACADLGSPGVTTDASGNTIDNTAVVPSTTPDGFDITLDPTTSDLDIGVGRMYVDGIVVENHGASGALFDPVLGEIVNNAPTPGNPPTPPTPVTYKTQPYWPTPEPLPTAAGNYLVYLDVWQREVTSLQHIHLIEQAVGVDTTTRTQDVWQVRVVSVDSDTTCTSADPTWTDLIAPSAARLTTAPVPVEPSTDPCVLPPTGGYRGLENQLYRVEIHNTGPNAAEPLANATFKWSRDNASVTSAVTAIDPSGSTVTVASLGKDDVLSITDGDWVEITDDNREFNQLSGEIRKVTVDVATKTLTLSAALPTDLIPASPDTPVSRHTRVIRWDQSGIVQHPDGTTVVDLDTANPAGLIPVTAGSQIVLENGIAVTFSDFPAGGNVRAGDYWVFAARTADTSIELLEQAPPRGIHHHYARLAMINAQTGSPPQPTDCRQPWPPECEGEGGCDCTICLTPTSTTTLQDAVNQLQTIGGTICLAAGTYDLSEPVAMTASHGIRIRGQGSATVLVAPSGAFTLSACSFCTIEDLAIEFGGSDPTVPAIALAPTFLTTLQRMFITESQVNTANSAKVLDKDTANPQATAITLDGTQSLVTIRENFITASVGITTPPPPAGGGALNTLAMRIESNFLMCDQAAIALRGADTTDQAYSYTVTFAYGISLSNNSIVLSGDGIIAVGQMLVEGALRIDGNQLQVSGDGITTSPSNCLVTANDIAAAGPTLEQPAQAASAGTGIQISSIQPVNYVQGGPATIENNTISGMTTAIKIGTTESHGVQQDQVLTKALRISHNTIQTCSNGIVAIVEDSDVSISENEIVALSAQFTSQSEGTWPTAWGISLNGGSCCLITDNTIDTFTVSNGAATGIGVTSTNIVTISRNLIANLNGTSKFRGWSAAGIDITGPVSSCDVSSNQVQLGTNSDTTAVQVDGNSPNNETPATVSITGNTLNNQSNLNEALGVSNAHDLQVSGNTAATSGGAFAMQLVTNLAKATIRCQNNLARAVGDAIAISVESDTTLAVLGNITTGQINATPALENPWLSLNKTAP